MTKIQSILLETFKVFADFCAKNEINYFACGGTAIGAVRHNGFIPWDDDMDVYVFRNDYDRFLSMRKELLVKGYEVLCYEDENYVRPFARMSSMSYTFLEYGEQKYVSGPNLDIICIDEAFDSIKDTKTLEKEYNRAIKSYQWCKAHHSIKAIFSAFVHKQWYSALNMIRRDLFYPEKKAEHYRELFRVAEEKARKARGSFNFCYFHSYPLKKELFPKGWFSSYINFPFENTVMRVPVGYDQYLTQLFGDYMKVPDVKHRKTHPCFYMNLERRMTLEEIREELKKPSTKK